MIPLAFISGPLTSEDPQLMQHRRVQAEAFGAEVRSECGCDTFVPHTEITGPSGLHGVSQWLWAMGTCICKLENDADLIVMMPDWNKSRGSRLEHAHALTRGIPVAYTVDEAAAIVARLKEGAV